MAFLDDSKLQYLWNKIKYRFIGCYTPQMFGAKADGVTDDTTAIQAAINAAQSSGKRTVYFPAGTYCISAPLMLQTSIDVPSTGGRMPPFWARQGVRLFGDSAADTRIEKTGTTTTTVLDTTVDCAIAAIGSGTGITLEKLTVTNLSNAANCYASYMQASGVVIRGCNFIGNRNVATSHGIYLYGFYNEITDTVIYCKDKALEVQYGTSTVLQRVYAPGCRNPYVIGSAYSTLISCCGDDCTGDMYTISGTATMVGCGGESRGCDHYIVATGRQRNVCVSGFTADRQASTDANGNNLGRTSAAFCKISGAGSAVSLHNIRIVQKQSDDDFTNYWFDLDTDNGLRGELSSINQMVDGGVEMAMPSIVTGTGVGVLQLNVDGYLGEYVYNNGVLSPRPAPVAETISGIVRPENCAFIQLSDGSYVDVPAFTNALTGAVNPPTGTINSYGTISGWRYTSGAVGNAVPGSETTLASSTGLIPISGPGDVVRLSGAYLPNNSTGYLVFADTNKNWLGGSNGTNVYKNVDLWGFSANTADNTMQITVPAKDSASRSLANARYVGITYVPVANLDIIATVNEAIAYKQVYQGNPMHLGDEVKVKGENVVIAAPNGTNYMLVVDSSGNLSTAEYSGG